MLSLLLTLPEGVDQALLEGKKRFPLMRSISHTERVSVNDTGMWILWLYRRDNPVGLDEWGIIYEAGPNNEQHMEFPGEMLQFFSKGEECYATALSHYDELVAEHNLQPMGIARNVRLVD